MTAKGGPQRDRPPQGHSKLSEPLQHRGGSELVSSASQLRPVNPSPDVRLVEFANVGGHRWAVFEVPDCPWIFRARLRLLPSGEVLGPLVSSGDEWVAEGSGGSALDALLRQRAKEEFAASAGGLE